jgi:menaquinol-cytochrome c reductase iron-sulfur subunit
MSEHHDPAPAPAPVDAAPATDGEAQTGEPQTSAGRWPFSRRSFVVRGLAAVGGTAAAIVGLPVLGFGLGPALRASTPPRLLADTVPPTLRSADWTSVGKLADFKPGVPRYVSVVRQVVDGWVREEAPVGVHVVVASETEATVFDPHCTHLGCPLAWIDGAGRFECPCHGGAFDGSGTPVAGPPPRPMDRYETKIENGELFIGTLQQGA